MSDAFSSASLASAAVLAQRAARAARHIRDPLGDPVLLVRLDDGVAPDPDVVIDPSAPRHLGHDPRAAERRFGGEWSRFRRGFSGAGRLMSRIDRLRWYFERRNRRVAEGVAAAAARRRAAANEFRRRLALPPLASGPPQAQRPLSLRRAAHHVYRRSRDMVERAQQLDRQRRDAVIRQESESRAALPVEEWLLEQERRVSIAEAAALYAHDEVVFQRRREAIADAAAAFEADE